MRQTRSAAWWLWLALAIGALAALVAFLYAAFSLPAALEMTIAWQVPVREVLCWPHGTGNVRLITVEGDGQLCFRDSHGDLVNEVAPSKGETYTSACIAGQDLILVASNQARVYAFTADDVVLWQYEIPLADAVAPGTPYPDTVVVLGEDGRIYCITNRGDVTALDESGTPLTHFSINEKLYIDTLPLVSSAGMLYVEAAGGDTLGVDADGVVRWRFLQC